MSFTCTSPRVSARAVDRHVELAEQERQPADVVLMAVGEEDGLQQAGPLREVGDLGDHDVHAEHLVLGEHQPDIDGDRGPVVFVQHHVAANVAKAAEGDHTQVWSHGSIVAALLVGRPPSARGSA